MYNIQGTVFNDSIPELGEGVGYRTSIVCKTTKLSERQIGNWITKGYFEPSLKNSSGSGNRRLFTFKDIVILRTYKSLLDSGVSIGKIAKAKDNLKKLGIDDLASVILCSDGNRIYFVKSADEIFDIMQAADEKAQAIFSVSIRSIWNKTEGELIKFKALSIEEEIQPPALNQLIVQKKNVRSIDSRAKL